MYSLMLPLFLSQIPGAGAAGIAACQTVCTLINSAGCGLGGFALRMFNPALGEAYKAVCEAIANGAVEGCTALCTMIIN